MQSVGRRRKLKLEAFFVKWDTRFRATTNGARENESAAVFLANPIGYFMDRCGNFLAMIEPECQTKMPLWNG